jgi:hypothetical protein
MNPSNYCIKNPEELLPKVNHTVEELETISAVTLTTVTKDVSLHKMALRAQGAQTRSLIGHFCFIFQLV